MLYEKYILPRVIHCACGTKPFMEQRAIVVPWASGTVLELGIGSGLNLPFYDPAKVKRVIGMDPSKESWGLASDRVREVPFDVEFIGACASQTKLDPNSVDNVLVTYALCTIPDPVGVLKLVQPWIRPGGRIIFCEHGKARDRRTQRWQNTLNPVWNWFAGGCHLNRDIPRLIEESGFKIERLEEGYLRKSPRTVGFNYWGTATL